VDDASVQEGSADHRFAIRHVRHVPHELLELGREPGEGALPVRGTLADGDVRGVRSAQPGGLLDNGLQNLVEVESGTRDRGERAAERCESGGFALVVCVDRTILMRRGRSTRSHLGQDLGAVGRGRNGMT